MILYNLAINLYETAIKIASYLNTKANKLHAGRKKTFNTLNHFKRDSNKKLLWVHCASLGEFEQVRPIIESLKNDNNIQLAVSFFSPSGYELRKNYELADVVFYLPKDTIKNAKAILDLLKPDVTFFVKYEIWINLINTLKLHQVKLALISASFRPDQIYFKWYGKNHLTALKQFDFIFAQNTNTVNILQNAGLQNAVFSNDTRFDRVFQNHQQQQKLPLIETFKDKQSVIILGSSYYDEELKLKQFLSTTNLNNFKVIIAPHHLSQTRISAIEKMFATWGCVRYSTLNSNQSLATQNRILIIDNIGMLSNLYQYAEIAFIGGGFGHKGIHNTLEAATFGMPIFIGPFNHQKFPETIALQNEGVLFVVNSDEIFIQLCRQFLLSPLLVNEIKLKSQAFIKHNLGATKMVTETTKHWLLTK